MKRIIFIFLVLIVSVGTVWAQFGTRPGGFDEYRSDEQELTFFYPSDWFVSESDGNVSIVNREDLLNKSTMDMPDLSPGDAAMVLGIMPTFLMSMMGIPVDDISTILDGMFQNIVSGNGSNMANSSKEVLEFGGRRVATVTFDDTGEEVSGIFFVSHEQEEVIMFAVAYGFRNSLDTNRATMAQLVSTAEFTGDLESMMQ